MKITLHKFIRYNIITSLPSAILKKPSNSLLKDQNTPNQIQLIVTERKQNERHLSQSNQCHNTIYWRSETISNDLTKKHEKKLVNLRQNRHTHNQGRQTPARQYITYPNTHHRRRKNQFLTKDSPLPQLQKRSLLRKQQPPSNRSYTARHCQDSENSQTIKTKPYQCRKSYLQKSKKKTTHKGNATIIMERRIFQEKE